MCVTDVLSVPTSAKSTVLPWLRCEVLAYPWEKFRMVIGFSVPAGVPSGPSARP